MKRIGLLMLLMVGCKLMALPEIQKETCINAIHGWHTERVTNINALTVPDRIKAELIAFSLQEEARQRQEICDLAPNQPITKKVP